MRKSSLLLFLVFIGCHGTTYQQAQVQNPCSNGASQGKGFVCVHATLTPDPDPVHQSRSGWVHAFMKNGDELVIASDVFENTGHQGSHAWGRVKGNAVVGQAYKYTILDVTTGKVKDPEVMIDP